MSIVLLFLQVGAAAIEIWTMDDGYSFDSVIVSNSAEEAADVRLAVGAFLRV